MKREQMNEVVEIISNDCQIAERYLIIGSDGNCLTCAVGALALHAGVSKDELLMASSNFIHHPGLVHMADRITAKTGLLLPHLNEIQKLNDEGINPNRRRKDILEYLKTLPVED